MPVSRALENSAKDFSTKYACNFDFITFESKVEEFTFLRPNNGWIDVYKAVFDRMYKKTLENVITGDLNSFDSEAMLDDFEYTLIRPYVKENELDIKHKPYVGMDRTMRLEYLDKLTKEAPSNLVELYTEKYRNGEFTAGQMLRAVKNILSTDNAEKGRFVEITGCIQALENISSDRSLAWRAFHPLKNSAEKRDVAQMKKMFIEGMQGGEEAYEEIAKAAYETFEGYKKVNENFNFKKACALEEMTRKQKMDAVIRESIHIDEFDMERAVERSQFVKNTKSTVKSEPELK